MAKVDINKLNSYVNQKLINVQKHPEADLLIWNYTPVCQYSRNWDEYTMMARGLITDTEGNIVARGFNKFFNYEEHLQENMPPIPNEKFRVTEKMDGSLIITYKLSGVPYAATRGSFTSGQSQIANKILREKYADFYFKDGRTYLFELIDPSNRIVVDYGDMSDLVLLAILDTETGENIAELSDYPFPVVRNYPMLPIGQLQSENRNNREGYVIQFVPSGMRVKIKHEDYKRLHVLLTQVSSKSIWELLRHSQPFDELLDNVPDEYFSWVTSTRDNLIQKHTKILDVAKENQEKYKDISRKEAALSMANEDTTVRSATFCLLDGKEARAIELIWKSIKPAYEQAYRKDVDA